MDFSFMGNWRGPPKQNARQQTRNYHTTSNNNKSKMSPQFLNSYTKTQDIVYDPVCGMPNWNRVFYTTPIMSDKKFNTPADFDAGKKMRAVKSDVLSNNFCQPTSRPNRSNSEPLIKPSSRPRVDFYPVFVGVSNFISGIVSNITGTSKEETGASFGVSPPIVGNSELRDISPDKNTTSNRVMNKIEAVSAGMTDSGRGAMDGQASESAVAVPAKSVNVAEVNGCVVSICEDKLQKLKEMFAAKKVKSRRKGNSYSAAKEVAKVETVLKKELNDVSAVQTSTSPENIQENLEENTASTDNTPLSDILEDTPEKSDISSAPSVDSPQTTPAIPLKSILKSKPSEGDFDEVKGRFKKCSRTSECGSDDSFVIVFQESDEHSPRSKLVSECESEDSFIVCFEEPTCFTNEDVFTDEGSESSSSEDDEPHSSCSLGGLLSHSISNLADQSLYSERSVPVSKKKLKCVKSQNVDEVDFAAKPVVIPPKPAKKVHFTSEPPRVHVMRTWSYAYRAARIGPWERAVTDRERFKRRIADADLALSWVLKPQHRSRVLFQRIMPWRHAQRRLELAEAKKKKEEEERIRKEKEEIERIQRESECIKRDEEQQSLSNTTESSSELDTKNAASNDTVNCCDIIIDNATNVLDCQETLDTRNNNVIDSNTNPVSSHCAKADLIEKKTKHSSATDRKKSSNEKNCTTPTELRLKVNCNHGLSSSVPKELIFFKPVNWIKNCDKSSKLINGEVKTLSDNVLKLNNALLSASTSLNEFNKVPQKLVNVVSKNDISNCLLTNGKSSSLQILPMHNNTIFDNGNINNTKSDVIIKNVTITR